MVAKDGEENNAFFDMLIFIQHPTTQSILGLIDTQTGDPHPIKILVGLVKDCFKPIESSLLHIDDERRILLNSLKRQGDIGVFG